MGGSQKSKRVTWATDVNLCQVRLFLSEECPSQVGSGGTQEHLQAKALWAGHSDDNLPPGFEGIQPANPLSFKLSQIPIIKWKCPPRFVVDSTWRVVAGEESREIEAQNQREMRVLEAIYPRPSAIPPNPSTLTPIEDSTNNNQFTPTVPITAIEDEDATIDTSHGSIVPNSTIPTLPQPQTINSHAEPDIVAAAQAALTSVMSNSGQGNLIDRDLLIKILSDPKMIEQLVTNRAASPQNVPSSSTQSSIRPPTIISPPPPPSSSLSPSSFQGMHNNNMPSTSSQYNNIPINRRDQASVSPHITRPEPVPLSRGMANGPFYPPPSRIGPIPNLRPPPVPDVVSAPSPTPPVTKDINYYKSLIQQHGGERREAMVPQFGHQSNQQMSQETKNKPKIMKPCIYFNSARGCRNGANCTYQHDMSAQQRVSSIPEVQSAKRVKFDREITGT